MNTQENSRKSPNMHGREMVDVVGLELQQPGKIGNQESRRSRSQKPFVEKTKPTKKKLVHKASNATRASPEVPVPTLGRNL